MTIFWASFSESGTRSWCLGHLRLEATRIVRPAFAFDGMIRLNP
jgi:hypothetical protein